MTRTRLLTQMTRLVSNIHNGLKKMHLDQAEREKVRGEIIADFISLNVENKMLRDAIQTTLDSIYFTDTGRVCLLDEGNTLRAALDIDTQAEKGD